MGLLKAGVGALSSVLADQWREYFYCDALRPEVLVKKGQKRTTAKGSNTKGSDNIITNGSIVAVNEGQCMIIVDQGKIVDVCAEAGEFVYDTSTEPSIFYGSLGESIKNTFNTIGRRFTFGADTAKDQRVYFVNTKEIVGNKYGTTNPVPFRVVDQNIGLDVDTAVRCNGEYSYKIVDPILFYVNVCGNVSDEYLRSEIDSMLKTELLTALQPTFAKISALGIRYSELPAHTVELANALNEVLSEKWTQLRGLQVASFGVNSATISKEDEQMIKDLQRTAVMRDPNMAAASLVGAQGDAMRAAASNKNGAMMGFMGMGMAQQAGGMNAQSLFAMGQQQPPNGQQGMPMQQQPVNGQQQMQPQPAAGGQEWTCSCGAKNIGKFCTECGATKPQPAVGWTCSCGTVNQGKFCMNCGSKKPAGEPLYKCDKCGWMPEDPKNPPKFCPECGDPFNDNDITNQ